MSVEPSLGKKIVFTLIAWLIVAIPTIVILELIFGRWIWNQDGWSQARTLNIIRNQQRSYSVSHLYDRDEPIIYTRNEYGLRDACDAPSDITILTMGGSTTDQRFLDDRQTFQSVLQQRLGEDANKQVCVSNAGVDGHSSYGHLRAFTDWFPNIADLKPSYVLVYVGINDAHFRTDPLPGYDVGRHSFLETQYKHKSATYLMLKTLENLILTPQRSNRFAGHKPRPPSTTNYPEHELSSQTKTLAPLNASAFAKRLDLLLGEIKQMGAVPICVSQPHYLARAIDGEMFGVRRAFVYQDQKFNGLDYDHSMKLLNHEMEKACPAAGGYYIDMASLAFEESDFYDLTHMTPEGAERLAGYLADSFASLGITEDLPDRP